MEGSCDAGGLVFPQGEMQLPRETLGLASQLQRLESSFSLFSEESNPNQLLAHLGRMAVEFNRLSSKVQKNEQRTSVLQVRRPYLLFQSSGAPNPYKRLPDLSKMSSYGCSLW